MRDQQGWIPNSMSDSRQDSRRSTRRRQCYAGGVNLGSVSNVAMEELTESFDEPLTMAEVRNRRSVCRGLGRIAS
ncbi:MAG: hypothetical protein R2832_00035 [Rhodothermales bacterium]